jgi:hypothetical protein
VSMGGYFCGCLCATHVGQFSPSCTIVLFLQGLTLTAKGKDYN